MREREEPGWLLLWLGDGPLTDVFSPNLELDEFLDRSEMILRRIPRIFSSVGLLTKADNDGRFTAIRLSPHSSTVR